MLERLKKRLPDAADDALLESILADAGGMICAYTLRGEVLPVLEGAQIEIACMIYNRMGMEGESAHAEGSLHRSADSLPEYIRRQLNPWRLAKAVAQ